MSRRFIIRLTQEELAVLAKVVPNEELSARESSRFANVRDLAAETLMTVRYRKGKDL